MTQPVMFRLLGTVEMICGDEVVNLGPPQQRAVLACLAVDAGRPVPLQTLLGRVWGSHPPSGARASLYAHMTRIRHAVERADPAEAVLARRPGGYVLDVDPDLVDLHRFRRLTREDDVDTLKAGLDLWCGQPLGDVPGDWAARMRGSLVKEQLDAMTRWAERMVALARPAEVVAPARALVAEHPLAEQLVSVLMRALATLGSAAEALELFAVTRARLVEDLGTDPGPTLSETHQAVLRGQVRPRRPAASRRPPAQLPADVYAFTGRERELAALDDLLPATGNGTAAVISVVSGTAGVGKTALVLHWAHRVRDRFPDGQLYVNLRGYAAEQPVSAADALAGMLTALGLAGSDIPLRLDDRSARLRSELSGRRVLVVLDNAATVDQVRPLLPGAPGCPVVVTSRDSLGGLVARHGARRLTIDLLPIDDAVRLLGWLVGVRVDVEPHAAKTLADQCAALPLALRVAAELAATRPLTPLSELAEELADRQQRLTLLDAGHDPRTAVRAVFSWSYQHLGAAAATAFRLIGLHPGSTVDPYAAAALGATGLPHARQLLDVLARANLIQVQGPDRYGMHDLLRAYARHLAGIECTEDERHVALTRLFDFYLATAAAAMDLLHPSDQHQRPRVPDPVTPAPAFDTADGARAWLTAEKANLVSVCEFGEARGWPSHTVGIATTVFRWLDGVGHNADSFTVHSLARRAAARLGDRAAEARALLNLGLVYWHQGLLAQAAEHLRRALDHYEQTADQAGQASALSNLGVIYWRQGRLSHAAEHLREALDWYRQADDLVGQAEALGNLGLVHQRLGQVAEAVDHHRQALALCQKVGYLVGEAYAWHDLGTAHVRLGRPDAAADLLCSALALFREVNLRAGEAEALNSLGEAGFAAGAVANAAARHVEALAVAVEIGDRYEQGRAHAGMAVIHESKSEDDDARRCWQQALRHYRNLGVPEVETVEFRLAALA